MSINSEIAALERRIEDLEQAEAVARNERTGRGPEVLDEIQTIRERIAALSPFAEGSPVVGGAMVKCDKCGKPFWPESLTDGLCENDRPEPEEPSESIQTVKLKGPRAPRS